MFTRATCSPLHIEYLGADLRQPSQTILRPDNGGRVQGMEFVLGTLDRRTKGAYDVVAKKVVACCREVGACLTCRKNKRKARTTARRLESLYVAKFLQQPGDKVNCRELNRDGTEYILEMPHYALTQISKIKENMMAYIKKTTRSTYLSALQSGADITRLTANASIAYAAKHPDSMTSMAVDMWAYCRVIEKEWKICGQDTLDLSPITDPQNVLRPLRIRLLGRFQETIENYRPETWFDYYFTIFMLLNHIEMASAHGNKFSKAFGLGRRYSDMKLAEAWFHTSKILLSRFHFVSNGSAPLRLDWKTRGNVHFSKFDYTEREFLEESQKMMTKNGNDHDMYWTHQLFHEQWLPGLPHIAYEAKE
ncbi:hypothetical protein QBC39DRAFT_394359 [Podospora conica]|nr:hypothetical protein QBC39DRAFT_394359 [Schizothecium conicum]